MQLFIASGESQHSQAWADEVALALDDTFDSVQVLPYAHWQSEGQETNIEHESQHLGQLAAQTAEPYAIFAKSIGTLVTLKAIDEGLIEPKYCIFVGLPFNWIKNKTSVAQWLKGYSLPTLFIQQSDDPGCGYDELEAVLEERSVVNHRLEQVEGNDHKYRDLAELKAIITKYLAVEQQD